MTNPTQPNPENPQSAVINTAQYEDAYGIEEDDVDTLAAMTHAVGNHLFNVDHQYVGGNSNKKALQVDHQKVFKDIPKSINTSSPKQQPNLAPVKGTSISSPPPKSPPRPLPVSSVIDNDIINRLERLESGLSTIRKAKRIKRGISYTVSSNSMKGVIRDAELLADYVISEVAKGVKTITIKRNDSKDTE